jgi:hypothetical protein
MLNRLEEIKMDKSSLKFFRKKELRKEVREIKSELKHLEWCLFLCRSNNNHYLLLILLL